MFIAYQRIEPTTRLRMVAAAFDRRKRAEVLADSGTVFDELQRGILGGPAAVFALLRRCDEGATMFSISVFRETGGIAVRLALWLAMMAVIWQDRMLALCLIVPNACLRRAFTLICSYDGIEPLSLHNSAATLTS